MAKALGGSIVIKSAKSKRSKLQLEALALAAVNHLAVSVTVRRVSPPDRNWNWELASIEPAPSGHGQARARRSVLPISDDLRSRRGLNARLAGRRYLWPPKTCQASKQSPSACGARLAEQGYVEGKNLVIEQRFADCRYDRMPGLAADLAQLPVDVLFTMGTRASRIVARTVRTTPLVVYSCDPFDHVTRLARPGGNVTGVTCMTTELSPKRLELLKELVRRNVFPCQAPCKLTRVLYAAQS